MEYENYDDVNFEEEIDEDNDNVDTTVCTYCDGTGEGATPNDVCFKCMGTGIV